MVYLRYRMRASMYGTIIYHYRAKGDSMRMIVKAEDGRIIPVPAGRAGAGDQTR